MKQLIKFKTAAYSLVALGLGTVAIAYWAQPVSADGIPTDSPMTYAGTLEEDGRLVNDTRSFRLTLWNHPTANDFAHLKCSTQNASVPIVDGHFRVPLANSCSAAVYENPDLWIEVEVNGQAIGRTKLGAVPYALEAARASELVQAAQDLLVPPGTIVAFAGALVPEGWLLCDGTELPREGEYARLFAAIGTAHGDGNGTSTFHLPDYRGMFLRGVDHGRGADPDVLSRTAAVRGGNDQDRVGSIQVDAIGSHVHDMRHTHPMPHTHGMAHVHRMPHTHEAGSYTAQVHLTSGDNGSVYIRRRSIDSYDPHRRLQGVGGSLQQTDVPPQAYGAIVVGTSGGATTTLTQGSRTADDSATRNSTDQPSTPNTAAASVADTGGVKNRTGESRPKNAYVNYIIKY
jgi:microcystin-dependent protein